MNTELPVGTVVILLAVNLSIVVLNESEATTWSSLTSRNWRTTGLYFRGQSWLSLLRTHLTPEDVLADLLALLPRHGVALRLGHSLALLLRHRHTFLPVGNMSESISGSQKPYLGTCLHSVFSTSLQTCLGTALHCCLGTFRHTGTETDRHCCLGTRLHLSRVTARHWVSGTVSHSLLWTVLHDCLGSLRHSFLGTCNNSTQDLCTVLYCTVLH